MQLITAKNLAALILLLMTPDFIYGEYYFYACLCFSFGNYILFNCLTSMHKPFSTTLVTQAKK